MAAPRVISRCARLRRSPFFVVGGTIFEPLNFVLFLCKLPLDLFFLGLQFLNFFFVHDFNLLTDK